MEERSRCLIFDPFAGISGDMTLGALLDLGLEPGWLQDLVRSLPVQADISVESVTRGSLEAQAVHVRTAGAVVPRRLDDVLAIIGGATLDEPARQRATTAFRRLADVESALHGVPADQVQFHEVGGDDAIVDIVGVCAAVARLGIDTCYTRPVALGHGWVAADHGSLPIPAPATLRLLEGIPVRDTDLEGEFTTPTGAALLATLTAGRRAPGDFTPLRSGYGAGSRDPATHPNCLRLILAQLDDRGPMIFLQADVDDMPPEYTPPLLEDLFTAGALDVSTHPLQMKKGRTGLRVEALAPDSARDAVARALLQHSTTLGLRYWRVQRETLPRSSTTIEWHGFTIRVKTATTPDGRVRRKPEYDDVRAAARALGTSPLRARQEIERLLTEP